MHVFSGLDLATLSLWLSQGQTAYNDLLTGKQVVSVGSGDKRLSFAAAQAPQLKAYLADLQTAITALAGNGNRRKGVYLVGGKGL